MWPGGLASFIPRTKVSEDIFTKRAFTSGLNIRLSVCGMALTSVVGALCIWLLFSLHRQLREMVKWTYSEQMLLFYIRTFKESMWPGGKLAESPPSKTDAQKLETRMAAKNKVLQNVPGKGCVFTAACEFCSAIVFNSRS